MRQLDGYTIRETLARGPRNVTYRAQRNADGMRVVLKTTLSEHPSHWDVLRYHREYALLRQLQNSPLVSEVLALERIDGCPVLSMKDDGGQPLDQILSVPLPLDRFLRLAAGIARAISSIHGQRIIHKDIKPPNILLVGEDGAIKLIDFAIATQIPVEYRAGEPPTLIEGTWPYISPEQTGRMNRGIDYRSDLYSLGVTFYRMLTGVLPFQGRDPLEWCYLHMTQPVTPPHKLRQDVPQVLSDIITKLLAKVAEERYQSASGLAHDLERCQAMLCTGGAVEHFVLGRADRPLGLHIPEKLYGRERELAELIAGFEQVKSGTPCGVMQITGPSGIGKSSLAQELQKQLVQARGIFLSGKFDQLGSNVPYHAFIQAFQTLLRHILAEDDAGIAIWQQRIMEAVGARGRVLTKLIPEVELVMGPGLLPEVPELGLSEAQNRFQEVLLRFVRTMARADSPLVIFFDDMQWADSGTLKLLQSILLDGELRHIFFVLGYRDNEVSLSHPFAMMREELRRSGVELPRIHVGPLATASLRHLIADTLHVAAEDKPALELTELVHAKTGGNPFFVIQFLRRLYHDGVLYLDPASGSFTYARERVVAQSYTDNVVEHIVQELRELPPATQQMLKVAGCIGAVFALADLASIMDKKRFAVVREIWPAIRAGLIVPIGSNYGPLSEPGAEPEAEDMDAGTESVQYRFLHDRIQQAAYALLGEEERIQMHLRIGRCWLKQAATEAAQEENLFAIVSQMNRGASGLSTAEERLELAKLNVRAARKASASAASHTAVSLCRQALDLLGPDRWTQQYRLSYEASLLMAESAYLSGNPEEADQLCLHILERAEARDSAPVYGLRSNIVVTGGQLAEGVAIALDGLRRFGLDLSVHPSAEEVKAAYASICALMADKQIEDLLDLPPMTDADKGACMEILIGFFNAAYLTDTNLWALNVMYMVELSLRFGNHPVSVHGYSGFAMQLCHYGRYLDGYRFARVCYELVERSHERRMLAGGYMALQVTSFWCRPLSETIEYITRGFEAGRQSSALAETCYLSVELVAYYFLYSEELEELYERAVRQEHFNREARFDDTADIIVSQIRLIQQLRGQTLAFDSFDDATFRLADFEATMPGRMPIFICWHHINMMIGRFMAGDFTGAMANAERAKELLWTCPAKSRLLDYHYYRGLLLARIYPHAENQEALLEELIAHTRQLEVWCAGNPSTFEDKYLLLSAELARIRGQDSEAMHLYTRAIASARSHGFVCYEALAYETAAYFYLTRAPKTVAMACIRDAHRLYQAWGAHGKAADLARRFAFDEVAGLSTSLHTGASASTHELDAGTLVKSIQAISSEVHTSHLVKKFLAIGAENAGADHAWLVVFADVSATVWNAEGTACALSADLSLSASVLAFVVRTGEALLLTDALHDPTYGRDPVIQRNGTRSLLCLPLVRHGTLAGCLYLENRLLANAFSHKRRAVLEVIATQAAISLDNAKLYDTLEERVAQRTRELEETQKQLVSTAHQAGMAEIASSILHNVGNVLSSLGSNVDVLLQHARDLRATHLSKAAGMLADNRASLGEFVTTHERGRLIPHFLSTLAEHLQAKERALEEGIAGMRNHLSHIEAVVAMQERYALHGMRLVESSLPQDLVEDALRLSNAALARDSVTIVRDYRDTEPQPLEKHRVLQILINLITNANHAMNGMPLSQARRLSIFTEQDAQETRITIEDTGHGFDAAVQDKLFVFGFTTRKDGHGLGLHSCAIQAQAMGGSIHAHSDGLGQGARFVLTLPRAEAAATRSAP